MGEVLTEMELEELWGGPLPELEEEYRTLGDAFPTGRRELAPYIMKKLFSLREAKAACALPGGARDVAKALDIPENEAGELLEAMAVRGKTVKTPDGYDTVRTLAFLKDYCYAQPRFDGEKDAALARMMIAWDSYIPGRSLPDGTFRIVPKWRSVKNVPGAMPCENMPQMLLDCLPDRIAFVRCPCRAVKSIADTGAYHPEMFRGDTGETYEQKDGLCLIVGPRAGYFAEHFGGYVPTEEELKAKIEHIETNGTYYTANNGRLLRVMCNCGDDCACGMRIPYEAGRPEGFARSRFRAYLARPDACVGCGTCERACMFHRSVKVIDGKAAVDPEACHGCGVCTVKCPSQALKMKLVRPADHIPKTL
ncbi:MAG: 4Fe-4S binding protein [Oscillospiraceae bacterium]|nr:4Fe-4S binding protein [Oscillospiraceae bacterium]